MAGLSPLRVVLADDDAMVRSGLRIILGGAPGLTVVGEAADGHEAVEVVTRTVPDVALMDVRMPRVDGLAATRRLRERGSPARILVLTTFDADDLVVAALRAGAAGFLLKDTAPADLVAAVRRAAREREVAVAVSEGLTNTEISQALHLGVATVKTHVGNVFAKLEVTNRVQVARYVHDAQDR